MKFEEKSPPRVYSPLEGIVISDCGELQLEPGEQISLSDASGKPDFDILKKPWGYYLGNSINRTMLRNGLRLALVESRAGTEASYYLNAVYENKVDAFEDYLREFDSRVVTWLGEPE